jgi:hypothetical protein
MAELREVFEGVYYKIGFCNSGVDSIVVVAVQMSFKGGCGVRWGISSFEDLLSYVWYW